jgi:hypothetical protein
MKDAFTSHARVMVRIVALYAMQASFIAFDEGAGS